MQELKSVKIEEIDKDMLEKLEKDEIVEIARNILVVLGKNSGFGYGICKVANMFAWETMKPKKDWGSILGTRAPLERYKKEELIKMLMIAKEVTSVYDETFRYRHGANIYIIDKMTDDFWTFKKLSWTSGKMCHKSLDDVIKFYNMMKERRRKIFNV